MLPETPAGVLTLAEADAVRERLLASCASTPNNTLLLATLQAAVPLEIAKLRQRGGPNDFQWEWVADFAEELAERADILLFRGERKGETATMLNRLVFALAVMAFAPGGVTLAGLHFEARPVGVTHE